MGLLFADQSSLLHAASGVIAYFWGVSFWWWFMLHLIFEYVENTEGGIRFINQRLKIWPGGKDSRDSLLNSVGDQFFGMLGWIIAAYLDKKVKGTSFLMTARQE